MIDFSLSAKEYSPLVLAFIGDAVYELYIRSRLVAEGNSTVNRLQKKSSAFVCAGAQYRAYRMIEDLLSEDEVDVLHRGRNAKSATVPKNADIIKYRHATGLEALFGYLYIVQKHERLENLMKMIYEYPGG